MPRDWLIYNGRIGGKGMKVFVITLILFILAFAGLAAGLLLKRQGIKGGCSPAPGSKCQCKSEGDHSKS
ncbi:MAG: hypothetical protein C0618_01095 [Desulfuromonas sp.]|nr:MAG: hypothetical protein C0618_01095 [Desulfuromonas sp.]